MSGNLTLLMSDRESTLKQELKEYFAHLDLTETLKQFEEETQISGSESMEGLAAHCKANLDGSDFENEEFREPPRLVKRYQENRRIADEMMQTRQKMKELEIQIVRLQEGVSELNATSLDTVRKNLSFLDDIEKRVMDMKLSETNREEETLHKIYDVNPDEVTELRLSNTICVKTDRNKKNHMHSTEKEGEQRIENMLTVDQHTKACSGKEKEPDQREGTPNVSKATDQSAPSKVNQQLEKGVKVWQTTSSNQSISHGSIGQSSNENELTIRGNNKQVNSLSTFNEYGGILRSNNKKLLESTKLQIGDDINTERRPETGKVQLQRVQENNSTRVRSLRELFESKNNSTSASRPDFRKIGAGSKRDTDAENKTTDTFLAHNRDQKENSKCKNHRICPTENARRLNENDQHVLAEVTSKEISKTNVNAADMENTMSEAKDRFICFSDSDPREKSRYSKGEGHNFMEEEENACELSKKKVNTTENGFQKKIDAKKKEKKICKNEKTSESSQKNVYISETDNVVAKGKEDKICKSEKASELDKKNTIISVIDIHKKKGGKEKVNRLQKNERASESDTIISGTNFNNSTDSTKKGKGLYKSEGASESSGTPVFNQRKDTILKHKELELNIKQTASERDTSDIDLAKADLKSKDDESCTDGKVSQTKKCDTPLFIKNSRESSNGSDQYKGCTSNKEFEENNTSDSGKKSRGLMKGKSDELMASENTHKLKNIDAPISGTDTDPKNTSLRYMFTTTGNRVVDRTDVQEKPKHNPSMNPIHLNDAAKTKKETQPIEAMKYQQEDGLFVDTGPDKQLMPRIRSTTASTKTTDRLVLRRPIVESSGDASTGLWRTYDRRSENRPTDMTRTGDQHEGLDMTKQPCPTKRLDSSDIVKEILKRSMRKLPQ